MTANAFARHLGLPRGENLYQIKRGNNGIVYDTPIAEQAITGIAAGSALTGMVPVAEVMYNDFMLCAADQIMNQAAKFRYMYGGGMKVPMTLRIAVGGGLQCAAHGSPASAFWRKRKYR